MAPWMLLNAGDAKPQLCLDYIPLYAAIPSPDRVSIGISGWAQDYYFPEWNGPERHLVSRSRPDRDCLDTFFGDTLST